MVLLASGQGLYTILNLVDNILVYSKTMNTGLSYTMTSFAAVIHAYRLAGFVAMMACAFSHVGAVCRGAYLDNYMDTISFTYHYVDKKKGMFLYYWAILSLAMLLTYILMIIIVFLLVAFEKYEPLQNCLIVFLQYHSPMIVKRVKQARNLKKLSSGMSKASSLIPGINHH